MNGRSHPVLQALVQSATERGLLPFLDLTHGCRSRLSAGRRPGLIAAAAAATAAAGQSSGDPPAGPGPLTSQPLKLTPWPHTSSCG